MLSEHRQSVAVAGSSGDFGAGKTLTQQSLAPGVRRRALAVLLGMLCLSGPVVAWAACTNGSSYSEELTLNWGGISPGLTAGSNYTGNATIPASTGNVTVNISIANNGTWNGSGGGAGGGRPGLVSGNLALGSIFDPASENLVVALTFRNPNGDLLPVENASFSVYDMDGITFFGSYRDQATLSAGTWTTGAGWAGTGGSTATITAADNSGLFACSGLSTNAACSATANTGAGTPVTSLSFRYNNARATATNPYQEIALSNVSFCVDPAMVPVTIASVEARQEGADLAVAWSTTMERANAGFNVLAELGDGWEPLNSSLIPSHAVDAEEPQYYAERFAGVAVDRILIEDVDIRGRAQRHGPFEVGRKHGADPDVRRVDVAAIRSANAPARGTAKGLDTAARAAATGATSARLLVTENGIQRITHADLLAAGVDLSGIAPELIGIADDARPVARYVDDTNGNGVFDGDDAIEFIGEAVPTLYSKANIYVLTSDGEKTLEASVKTLKGSPDASDAYMATYRSYPDKTYSASAPVGSIPWYDALIRAYGGPATLTRTFDLPDLDGLSATSASLEIDLWGQSDFFGPDDHHVLVSLNGVEIADRHFDGLSLDRIQLELAAGALRTTGNQLVISLPFDTGSLFDFVGLDGFQVTYPALARMRAHEWSATLEAGAPNLRVGGISDCAGLHLWAQHRNRPYRLADVLISDTDPGCAVTLPSRRQTAMAFWIAEAGGTHSPRIQADVPAAVKRANFKTRYLIVTHPLFAGSLSDLVALQETRGLRTQVVTTDAIYAAYSDHERAADAIQTFIRASAKRPRSRLKYVLFVGGDVYDYFNIRGAEALSFVPTQYAKVGDLINFAPTDVLYGDVDGDGLPDLATGRLIARSTEELEAVINKLVAYDGGREALVVTGRSDAGSVYSMQHQAMTQDLADGGWTLIDLPVDDYVATSDARTELLAQLGFGYPLVSYLGHSDYDYWDFGPLFHRNDVARIPDGQPPFVVTQWGCWNSYFVSVSIETMAHTLLLTADKGAASVIGSSSLTSLDAHDAIGKRFFSALSQGPIALGDALLQAQREAVIESPSFRDDILALILLGDPALVVGR